MDMKTLYKAVEKIELREAMSLDELYNLMMENSAAFPKKFKLKKGLFGKAINFEVFMQTQPKVTVKDNIVTVRRIQNKSSVSVGGAPAMDFKYLKQSVQAVKEGGLGKAVTGGQEHFLSVCDAMRELLKSRMA